MPYNVAQDMNYKDHNITRAERMQMQDDIGDLRPYILAIKKKTMGFIGCEQCGKHTDAVDIHHTTYKKDLNYYDLMLLCWDCHKPTIGFDRQ